MSLKKIELSDKEELRVGMRRLKGRAFADVRVYAGPNAQEPRWPTGKGFLIPASRLPDLRRAMDALEAEASEAAG